MTTKYFGVEVLTTDLDLHQQIKSDFVAGKRISFTLLNLLNKLYQLTELNKDFTEKVESHPNIVNLQNEISRLQKYIDQLQDTIADKDSEINDLKYRVTKQSLKWLVPNL